MYDDWGNEIAGPVDHMLLVDSVAGPTFLPSPTVFRDDLVWTEAFAQPSVDDFLVLLKVDNPFVLPTQDEHSFLNVKPGSDEDWLTPLSNEADLGEIVVPPPSPGTPSDPNSPFDPNGDNTPHDTNQGAYGDPTPQIPNSPDCDKAEDIGIVEAPDGAKYFVPEGIDADYIIRAIDHLSGISEPASKLLAFNDMYTNPDSDFFIDFKDWGNANGPDGSQSGGTIRYYSDAVGGFVTASPFEAFGNYLYGFIGVLGGIDAGVLGWAAGALQTGNALHERLLGRDDPQDRPHVAKGITDALKLQEDRRQGTERPVFDIKIGNCSTGVTGVGSV